MRTFVTVVSGLPRSGTSLMMQMLAAGDMPILTDGARVADEDNPRGYLEFEAVKRTKQDASWLAHALGKAVKMVYLLLRDLPPIYDYRVIMMRRDLTEVVASQQKMLERSGRAGAQVSGARLAEIYVQQLRSIAEWLAERQNFAVLDVSYRECLSDPASAAARVNEFLGGDLDMVRMARAVDAGLYRNRA